MLPFPMRAKMFDRSEATLLGLKVAESFLDCAKEKKGDLYTLVQFRSNSPHAAIVSNLLRAMCVGGIAS